MSPTQCTRTTRPRRGFALITALVLLGLVVTLMVTMTSQLRMQIRRSAAAEQEAQFRELLLAGQTAASQTLDSVSPQRLPVPPELADGKATITCTRDRAHPEQVLVQATLAGQSREQRLYYKRGPNGWQLDDAVLDPR